MTPIEQLEWREWRPVPGHATYLKERPATTDTRMWVWGPHGPYQLTGTVYERAVFKAQGTLEVFYIFSVPDPAPVDPLDPFTNYLIEPGTSTGAYFDRQPLVAAALKEAHAALLTAHAALDKADAHYRFVESLK